MSITRVDYRERQRLTAADLRAEQDYRLAAAGRHVLGPHDWGVVTGLRVSGTPRGPITVAPGLAIDGYGREILVLDPVRIDVPDTTRCWSLLLYYCERPEQVPPGRICQDDPAPRIRHAFTLALIERGREAALPAVDLGLARAGGPVPGRSPWPVRLARIGTACAEAVNDTPYIDMGSTRYVGHRATAIHGPWSAAVQLGLRNREDLYHFLVTTRAGRGAAAERRLGIDRDGDVHVWKPLWISGSHAGSQLAYAAGRVARFVTAMPSGIGRRLRVDGTISARGVVQQAMVVDRRPQPSLPLALTATLADRERPDLKTLLFESRPIAIQLDTLLRSAAGPAAPAAAPRRRAARRVAAAADVPLAGAFSLDLSPFDGRLSLARRTETTPATAAPVCGDVDRYQHDRAARGPVVQWTPGPALAADPIARELHAVDVSAKDAAVPATAFRISGGADDPSDASARVAIGAHDGAAWVPALQMNGARALQVLGTAGEPALAVKGALHLPPIGRDDPLFPELMALAFMGGLFQRGARMTGFSAEVQGVTPNELRRGATYSYDLRVTNTGGPVTLQRCFEAVSGATPGRADVVFRPLALTLPAANGIVAIPGPVPPATPNPPFRHRAAAVEIRVLLLLKRGTTTTGVVVARSNPIAVVD